MSVDFASLQSHATLESLTLLGVSVNGANFVQRNNRLEPDAHPAWHPISNGNPPNMLDVTRSLFEDNGKRVLFIVERDTNRNVLMYSRDSERVVEPLWLMIQGAPVHYNADEPFNDEAEIELGNIYTEDLTPLEASIGYGLRVDDSRQHVYMHALREQAIYVRQLEGEWHAMIEVTPNTPPLFLRRITIITQPRPFAPWPRIVEVHVEVQQSLQGPLIVYRYGV